MCIKKFLKTRPLKQWTTVCLIAFVGVSMANCSDDDTYDDGAKSREELLEERFPGVADVTWSTENGLNKAEFLYDDEETVTWFNDEGVWAMTQRKVGYDGLPAAVRNSFESGEYKDYPQNALYHFHFEGGENTYAISLVKDSSPTNLYYRENGELYRVGESIFRTYVPIILSETQQKAMNEKYPNAILLEARLADKDIPDLKNETHKTIGDEGDIRVNIIHDGVYKEVCFNGSNWTVTTYRTQINYESLDESIKDLVEEKLYLIPTPNCSVSENIIYQERPKTDYYIFFVFDPDGEWHGLINVALDGSSAGSSIF